VKKELRSKLDRAWQDQAASVKEWKARTGGKAIGLPLTDVPEELVWAAGALPVTVLGRDLPLQHADKHLQGFACAYSRSLTEQAERGDLDFLDGLIMPYACDTTRCLDLIFRYMKRDGFYDCLRLPKRITTEAVRTYYTAELHRVADALGAFTGKPVDNAALSAAIQAYNAVRAQLAKLRDGMREGREGVRLSDYLSAVRAAMSLAPDVSAPLLAEVVAELGAPAKTAKPRVVLAGKMAEPTELADLLEAAGLSIIEDHLVVGGRWVEAAALESGDPWLALVDRHQSRLPFAGIWTAEPNRGAYLLRRAKATGAVGAVVLVQKFCEILEIDIPGMKEVLEKDGVPMFSIETDLRSQSLESVRTRVEAFAEMLKAR